MKKKRCFKNVCLDYCLLYPPFLVLRKMLISKKKQKIRRVVQQYVRRISSSYFSTDESLLLLQLHAQSTHRNYSLFLSVHHNVAE